MPDTTAPTQVRHPARTAVRTFVQIIVPAVITAGVVLPLAVEYVLDSYGETMPPALRGWLLAGAAFVAATGTALSRIMAIPAVERFLRSSRFTRWLAAEPAPVPAVDVAEPSEPIPGTTLPDEQVYSGKHAATYHDGQGA